MNKKITASQIKSRINYWTRKLDEACADESEEDQRKEREALQRAKLQDAGADYDDYQPPKRKKRKPASQPDDFADEPGEEP